MGNVADQLPVLLLALSALLRGLLQAQAHVLIIAVQIPDLSLEACLQGIFKITLLDFAHGHIQLIDRDKHSSVNPSGQHDAGKNKNQKNGDEHIHQKMLGNQIVGLGHHKGAALVTVRKDKIHLLYKLVKLVVIKAGIL